MVLAWLSGGEYHISITRNARCENTDRWWSIYNRWHGAEVVIWVDYVRSGGSVVLSGMGPGTDEDVLFLRSQATNLYRDDPLHISM